MSPRLLATAGAFLVAVPSGCSFESSSPAGAGPPGDGSPALDARDDGSVPADRPGEPAGAPASCREARDRGASESGVLEIDPGGTGGPFAVHCDMETEGGGWTLALKADGERSTFRYDSPLWTSEELLDPDRVELDLTEAKLASFNRVPFTEVGGVLRLRHGPLISRARRAAPAAGASAPAGTACRSRRAARTGGARLPRRTPAPARRTRGRPG